VTHHTRVISFPSQDGGFTYDKLSIITKIHASEGLRFSIWSVADSAMHRAIWTNFYILRVGKPHLTLDAISKSKRKLKLAELAVVRRPLRCRARCVPA
jgi:CelD/BcsL family acetyltransferase involved in cellulose biosynthesis